MQANKIDLESWRRKGERDDGFGGTHTPCELGRTDLVPSTWTSGSSQGQATQTSRHPQDQILLRTSQTFSEQRPLLSGQWG